MVLKNAHYEVILLYNVVSATAFNILNQTFSNQKAHYEVIMNDKVLSLIKEAEAHYQELEKDRLLRLMPSQSGRASNVPDGLPEALDNVSLPL